ncbi:hypothetical protein HOY82DRAFT_568677, partial [Tuber indicum]
MCLCVSKWVADFLWVQFRTVADLGPSPLAYILSLLLLLHHYQGFISGGRKRASKQREGVEERRDLGCFGLHKDACLPPPPPVCCFFSPPFLVGVFQLPYFLYPWKSCPIEPKLERI